VQLKVDQALIALESKVMAVMSITDRAFDIGFIYGLLSAYRNEGLISRSESENFYERLGRITGPK